MVVYRYVKDIPLHTDIYTYLHTYGMYVCRYVGIYNRSHMYSICFCKYTYVSVWEVLRYKRQILAGRKIIQAICCLSCSACRSLPWAVGKGSKTICHQ